MIRTRAYLTVYLALCLTVILSLYMVLIEGARRSGTALEATCVAEASIQSIMAEYHRELFKQYNILAIDASYGTADAKKHNTEMHMLRYMKENTSFDNVFLKDYVYKDFLGLEATDAELTQVRILTDYKGAVFRRCAVNVMREDIGEGYLNQVKEWLNTVEINGLTKSETSSKKRELDQQLEEMEGNEIQISEKETLIVDVDNPTLALERTRSRGILKLVIPKEVDISCKEMSDSNLVKNRMKQDDINTGNMELGEANVAEKLLFQEYLMNYMGFYGKERDNGVLRYQIEYLLNEKTNDTDNLRLTADKICALRDAANVMYLMSDAEKMTEIQAMAIAVCGAVALPSITPIVEAIILLGWASAESILDVKTLMGENGRVPLIKTKATWKCSLNSALSGEVAGSSDNTDGLRYEDYLRILLSFSNLDKITALAMNVIEANIRQTPGNHRFRMDACYDGFCITAFLESRFGYRYEVTRKRQYN